MNLLDMGHWNYRVVRQNVGTDSDPAYQYSVREVYYSKSRPGYIVGVTESVDPLGDSLHELVVDINRMLSAALNYPVLRLEDLPGENGTEDDEVEL